MPLRKAYDVVIIGGGGHGLACAYYLARDWGITNVAVLEKGWLASGNTASYALRSGIAAGKYLSARYFRRIPYFSNASGTLVTRISWRQRAISNQACAHAPTA